MSRSRVRAELRRVSARALAAATITLGGCASGPLDRLAEPGAPVAAAKAPVAAAKAPVAAAKAPVAAAPAAEDYVYVVRGPRVTIGLAEARAIDPEHARGIVDRLAASFEACASRLEREGALASGAGRLVVLLDDRGHVTASDAKLAPGSEAARAALLCLIGPARGLSYPPVAPGKSTPRRGFAVEAVWEGPGK